MVDALTDWDIVEVTTSSVDENGYPEAQADWIGDSTASGATAIVHHPLGVISVPLSATTDTAGNNTTVQAATALKSYEGGRVHMIYLMDPRVMGGFPNWQPGDGALYSPSGKGNYFRAKYDGSCSIRALDVNGQDIFYTVNTSGAPGVGFGFVESAPWGTRTFDASGFHVKTQWGACLDLGGYDDGGPLSQLGMTTTANVRAASISLEGASVKLGSGTGHTPVALVNPLLSVLGDVVTALKAVSQTIQDFIPGSGGASFVPTDLAALTAAIEALSTAVSAQPNPIASLTTNSM